MSGRCRACNKELDNPVSRYIEDADIVVEEDLCPLCLTIAMAAVHNRELTDDQLFHLTHTWETIDDADI